MPLNKPALEQAIKDIRNIDVDNGEITNDELAQRLADAIDSYVRTGDVIIGGGSSAGLYKVT